MGNICSSSNNSESRETIQRNNLSKKAHAVELMLEKERKLGKIKQGKCSNQC